LAVAVVVMWAAPAVVKAVDAPHDSSFSTGSCTECHKLHLGTGGSGQPTNATMCLSCHNQPGRSPRVAWLSSDQAVPQGTPASGTQHRWDAPVTSDANGAQMPLNYALSSRTPGGVLQCSTCHDLHKANAANAPGSVHASVEIGQPVNHSGGSGTGRMTVQPLGANPVAKGYRVWVVAGPGFILSHDFGATTPTWQNWVGGAWQLGAMGGAGMPFTPGVPVALDDPAVTVVFEAGTAPGDYWDFYVAYPFVRAYNAAGEMCLDCHRDRAQDHFTVEGTAGYGWGGKPYSHPVGEVLNANASGYDRAEPLDANGAVQGSAGADGNKTNDLVLYGGQVTCLSCHAPHGADSNSLTVDQR
jgi:cytochrome c553